MSAAQKRILIVEDHPDVLENYKKNVVRAGYFVDTASAKDEAIEKVRRRTYHVAMIDVNLTDYSGDGNDRSGIEIVKEINARGEGTKCIVISGEQSSEVPVDAHDAGIDKYIIKKRIRTPQDYMEPVNELANACAIRPTGRFGDLIAYFSLPEKRWAWEGVAMHIFKCDALRLPRILDEVFSPFLPVLRRTNASFSLSASANSTEMTGTFWSKAIARPIWVAIGQKYASLTRPDDEGKNSELLSSRKKGTAHAVWSIDSLKRSDFYDNVDDIR